MDARLHAVNADTGALCEGFGEGGVLNVDQWNTVNAVVPFPSSSRPRWWATRCS